MLPEVTYIKPFLACLTNSAVTDSPTMPRSLIDPTCSTFSKPAIVSAFATAISAPLSSSAILLYYRFCKNEIFQNLG